MSELPNGSTGGPSGPGPSGAAATAITPLFLVSLPRSGSTLLQRMLATHAEISTSPEPTFLLPLLHLDRETDVVATYDQKYTAWAIQDFTTSLPRGRDDYREAIADFARDLYGRAAPDGAVYHLDKTPKYHLIVDDLLELFDDAKVILLWRNPLACVASMISTWGRNGGRWNLNHFRLDLYEGILNMLDVADRFPDRVIEVHYEHLVDHPAAAATTILEGLGIEADPTAFERFADVSLVGRVQDPNAAKPEFRQVRSDRVDEWRRQLANPVRRAWCRRYLDWLGEERLARMGYSKSELEADLDGAPSSTEHLATDLLDLPLDVVSRLFETRLLVKKLRDQRNGRRLLAHK